MGRPAEDNYRFATLIFLMAGVLRVPLARFLLADGLYAIPGVGVMFSTWASVWLLASSQAPFDN